MSDESPVILSDRTTVGLPIKNMIALCVTAGVAVWGYFGLVERLNKIETNYILMQSDVTKNSTFSELWPRGQLSAHSQPITNSSY